MVLYVISDVILGVVLDIVLDAVFEAVDVISVIVVLKVTVSFDLQHFVMKVEIG